MRLGKGNQCSGGTRMIGADRTRERQLLLPPRLAGAYQLAEAAVLAWQSFVRAPCLPMPKARMPCAALSCLPAEPSISMQRRHGSERSTAEASA